MRKYGKFSKYEGWQNFGDRETIQEWWVRDINLELFIGSEQISTDINYFVFL